MFLYSPVEHIVNLIVIVLVLVKIAEVADTFRVKRC